MIFKELDVITRVKLLFDSAIVINNHKWSTHFTVN